MSDCEEGFAFAADEPERRRQRKLDQEILLENAALKASIAELEAQNEALRKGIALYTPENRPNEYSHE